MKKRNEKGFTLVETLIYVSFLVVFSGLVIASLLLVTKNFYMIRLERDLRQSGTVAAERMVREMRNSYAVDTENSNLRVSPGGNLILKKKGPGGTYTTVEFYVNSNGQLALREGGVEKGALMEKNVKVTYFRVNYFGENYSAPALYLDFTLEIASILGGAPRTFSFQTGGVLRGGATGPY